MMKKILSLIALLSVSILSSCLNSYEKEAVGEYELYTYELKDSDKEVDNLSKLILQSDKTFQLKYNNKSITGTWEVEDYGDWTLIELNSNGKVTEGKILSDSILFEGGFYFGLDNFKNMEYTRTVNIK